jgi:DNA-binding CsgD family transcriptional regulator
VTDEHDDLAAALEDTRTPASEARGTPGHDSADEIARGARLLRLRAARMSYAQIARVEGYSDKSTARQALLRALTRHEAENVTELRTLENLALDEDERALRTIIANSATAPGTRIRAIDSRTRLSARRSRLNGLDAPLQVQLSAGVAADLADAIAEAEQVFGDIVPGFVVESRDEPMEDERREG